MCENIENQNIISLKTNNQMLFRENYIVPKNNAGCYLIDVLMENWSFLFKNFDNIKRNYYVYYHTDPIITNSMVFEKHGINVKFYGSLFYFGKGTKNRYKEINNRSTSHINKVKTILSTNIDKKHIFKIFQDNLTELEAFELETKLITIFGRNSEYSRNTKYFLNKKGGLLINSDISKRPKWINDIINMRNFIGV